MILLLTAELVLVILLVLLFASRLTPLRVLDKPNERSLHEKPIPKTGGIALLIGLYTVWLWLFGISELPQGFRFIAGASLLVAIISFVDDLKELSPLIRIAFHSVAALLLIYAGLTIHDSIVGNFLTFLAIVWMLNLYNFMDGMDGFAGGMTFIGFAMLGTAGAIADSQHYALLSWTVAVASLGFLTGNFPPAKVFMGDAGSATIGFLVAGFSLWGIRDGVFPLWFPLLVFSPFILDATVTLFRRGLRGERVWQAHREHYYQRLALAGWGHKKTVLSEYILMLAVGISSIVMLSIDGAVYGGLIFWGLLYMLLAYKADNFCQKKRGSTHEN